MSRLAENPYAQGRPRMVEYAAHEVRTKEEEDARDLVERMDDISLSNSRETTPRPPKVKAEEADEGEGANASEDFESEDSESEDPKSEDFEAGFMAGFEKAEKDLTLAKENEIRRITLEKENEIRRVTLEKETEIRRISLMLGNMLRLISNTFQHDWNGMVNSPIGRDWMIAMLNSSVRMLDTTIHRTERIITECGGVPESLQQVLTGADALRAQNQQAQGQQA